MPAQETPDDQSAGDRRPVRSRLSPRWLVTGGICLAAAIAIGVALWVRPDAAAQRDPEQDRQSARELVAAWDTAITTDAAQPGATRPVLINSALQGQDGEWEPALGENNKLASEYNAFVAAADVEALPTPSGGRIRWQDGVSRTVPVLDAASAATALAESPNKTGGNGCDGCTPLELTDPRLGTAEVDTPFGPAVVPEWSFAVEGSAVRLTRVGIDPAAMLAVPDLDYGVAQADLSQSVTVNSDGTLTYSFIGGPPADTGECGMDYAAELIESQHAVAVLVTSIPNDKGGDSICNAAGFGRSVTVTGHQPVGDRVVIDLAGRALARR